MNRRELLERWAFPHFQRHGVTLVARSDAIACVERIYAESCRFLGYDAFALFPGNGLQPHGALSANWSNSAAPAMHDLIRQLRAHPPGITHYEFVFDDAR